MPSTFTSPDGRLVGEDEACINGAMRDGYRLNFALHMRQIENAPEVRRLAGYRSPK